MREPSSERLYQLIRRRRGERQKELVLESGVGILRSKLTTIGKIQFPETDRPQPRDRKSVV